jgi:arylsulfatase A-like enzyme
MEFFEHDTWGQGNSAVGDFSSRIPLVIRDPRKPGCGTIDKVVRSIDLAPTLLELVGSAPVDCMDGVSLAASLDNPARCPELDAYNETGIWIADIPGLPTSHLRYPNLLDLITVPDIESGTLAIKEQYRDIVLDAKDRMIRRGKWKLVSQPLTDGTRTMLFNVDEDPGCTRDCITAYPEIGAQLSQALHAWATAGPNARPGTMSERTSVM